MNQQQYQYTINLNNQPSTIFSYLIIFYIFLISFLSVIKLNYDSTKCTPIGNAAIELLFYPSVIFLLLHIFQSSRKAPITEKISVIVLVANHAIFIIWFIFILVAYNNGSQECVEVKMVEEAFIYISSIYLSLLTVVGCCLLTWFLVMRLRQRLNSQDQHNQI